MSEQYVRVPRELLERVETWVQADCQALTELQALLAAPAEDVRAVVDEPVCYTTFGILGIAEALKADGGTGRVGAKLSKTDRFCVPLYLHPSPGADFCKVCIDRHVAELNK